MAEEASGFLGRWARRKNDALQGKPLDEPAPAAAPPLAAKSEAPPASVAPMPAAPAGASEQPEKPLLTLEDVKLLTKDSDFKPFMASGVGPEVRNAAMKKLFADPHFNIMDGLDTYIDDYSKSDPIPESMLRQMTSAKFFKLFDDKQEATQTAAPSGAPRENANKPAGETVAQSSDPSALAEPHALHPEQPSQPQPLSGSGASQEHHAHTDLRLQPDHAAPAPDAGRGTQ